MSRRYALTALVLALAFTGCVAQPLSHEQTPTASPSVTAAPTPTEAAATPLTPQNAPAPAPEPSAPVLTVTTTATMPWGETLDPPSFEGVYRVIDDAHGFPEDGTKYILTHATSAISGQRAPGNDWLDADLQPGDTVVLDGLRYVAGTVSDVDKDALAEAPIWGPNDPDRAVLITCRALWAGTAAQNHVISLDRIG